MAAPIDPEWQALLDELAARSTAAESMGGDERLARQRSRGRLNARERVAALCDDASFCEYGLLAGSCHPAGATAVPADGLVCGVARIAGSAVVVVAEDFSVQGGTIGHVNAAKRQRMAMLAATQKLPFVILLDGAGERASNAEERYPLSPSDLQTLADLRGTVPMITLVLGTSAGHGALSGLFSDLVIATEGSALFAAGPPLVRASLGIEVTPDELGSARMHATDSGVVHNLVASEPEAFQTARRMLSLLVHRDSDPQQGDLTVSARRRLDDVFEIVPADLRRSYELRRLLIDLVDDGSLLEVQPLFGQSVITAFARLGGQSVLVVANDPLQSAGAITKEGAEKATHFLGVAASFELPVVFLADNPGVMAGPAAERAGTLRAAAAMYTAQRKLTGPKLHVTLRKAFGFGSSLMAMNPYDHQTVTLAFPGITLGGVPAAGGADAAGASDEERARMIARQSGAWSAADNGSYDRVIDPRELRNELLTALGRSAS